MAERFRERIRHVQRYRCVRDLRQRGHTLDDALSMAVVALKARGDAVARSTIKSSYLKIFRDLKNLGPESEYSFLVARCDPVRVPVSIARGPDGEVIINGVKQSPRGR